MPFPVTYVLDQRAPSETFIRREIELLAQRGWPVRVATLHGGEEALSGRLTGSAALWRAAAARLSQDALRSPADALRLLKRLPQAADLARLATETGSRLLHAHFAGVTADLAGVTARALGLPWTCSVHAHDVFAAAPALLRRRLSSAATVAACSHEAARAVSSSGIPAARVSLIRHGLPLDDYPFLADRPRGQLFAAGRLVPKKGFDILLHACAQLRDSGLRVACTLAGEGPLREPLERLAGELGLADVVRFAGWLSQADMREQLARATALVLPSRRTADGDRDGVANVVVESLALGTPVVTTTASAAHEVITHAKSGWLIEPDDPGQLAGAIKALDQDPALRRNLARKGRELAEAEFDGAANIARLEALFEQAALPPPNGR